MKRNKLTRGLGILLSLVLVLGMVPLAAMAEEGTVSVEFTDIDSHWAKDYITALASLGYITGNEGDTSTYAPDVKITRADFVQFLANIFAEDIDSYADAAKFDDVDADATYAKAVAWAVELEIVNGISETEFAPDNQITREQMAALIIRTAGKFEISFEGVEVGDAFADDEKIAEYAYEAVYLLRGANIVGGRDTGEFDPQGNITRAEVAKILFGLLSYADMIEAIEAPAEEAAEEAADEDAGEDTGDEEAPEETEDEAAEDPEDTVE